jgi:flagellar hook-associated protein 3 FlgL
MRISTSSIHRAAITSLMSQQSVLSKTQTQIASGKRVQTPADDPVAAVHILELQRALAESEQFATNADMAKNRLTLEEQALADANTLMQRVRELTIQGSNATVDPASRHMLAQEIRGHVKDLMDIANRRDANGEYLFSGYATQTQPFAQTGGTITYFGDQGNRSLQVGTDQRVVDGHSGVDTFMSVAEGNGTFVTNATAGNAGNGVIGGGTLVDPAQWVAGDYTLRFTSATGDYEILDGAAVVVAAGAYTQNSTISFNGANIDMTGMPAQNDTFTIARSRSEDMFTTLSKLADALESSTATQAERANFNSDMATVLQQLDQAGDHLLNVRAQVGTRLASIDSAQESLADRKVELETTTSQLRDLDYAEAVSRMNQQLVGLQAAQASYSKIAQLSLFDYLR